MKIDKFEEFFTEARVPYKRIGNRTLVVGRVHFLFKENYEFTGVADGASNAVTAPTSKKVGSRFAGSPARESTKKETPWELEHALECDEDGDHEFVQDCKRQWDEKGFLTEKQKDALGRWKPKGDF